MQTMTNPRRGRTQKSVQRMYGNNSSRSNTPSKERRRRQPCSVRTPPELIETSDESDPVPMKRDFVRSRSPIRSRRPNGRQPDSPLTPVDLVSSKRGKRTVTTMKRTKKTSSELPKQSRSELPQSSPILLDGQKSRHRHSLSQQRAVHPGVVCKIPEPELEGANPTSHPLLFQPKSHKYRTKSCKGQYREQAQFFPFQGDDYEVDMARVRSANTHESNLLRTPELDDEEDNLSQTSSSIFADLDKEEDSTIWGDLEDNSKTRRHENSRRRLAAVRSDASEQYGEIRLPTHHENRSPSVNDIDSTGGGITAAEADSFFADPISICVFLQDMVHDCVGFFKHKK
mgnify:CR=1 FL=1